MNKNEEQITKEALQSKKRDKTISTSATNKNEIHSTKKDSTKNPSKNEQEINNKEKPNNQINNESITMEKMKIKLQNKI